MLIPVHGHKMSASNVSGCFESIYNYRDYCLLLLFSLISTLRMVQDFFNLWCISALTNPRNRYYNLIK